MAALSRPPTAGPAVGRKSAAHSALHLVAHAIRRSSPRRTLATALLRICTIASSATLRDSNASAPLSSDEAIAKELISSSHHVLYRLVDDVLGRLNSAGDGSCEVGSIGIVGSLHLIGGGFRWVFHPDPRLVPLHGLDFPHACIHSATRHHRRARQRRLLARAKARGRSRAKRSGALRSRPRSWTQHARRSPRVRASAQQTPVARSASSPRRC